MKKKNSKITMKERRHRRIRAKIRGTAKRPRLNVFRSNKYVFLQLIDDEKGKTLLSESDAAKTAKKGKAKITKITKTESAREAGKKLAEKAAKRKIKYAVFDRGGYAYHGRVKAAAEGAREGGLKF